MSEIAARIVAEVLKELEGRRGIGQELRHIDEDVYVELRETLEALVQRIIEASGR